MLDDNTISKRGYLWQPYEVCSWPQLSNIDPDLTQKISDQRKLLQSHGYISSRKYPAQIFVSYSGKSYPSREFLNRQTYDFLQGKISFHMIHKFVVYYFSLYLIHMKYLYKNIYI